MEEIFIWRIIFALIIVGAILIFKNVFYELYIINKLVEENKKFIKENRAAIESNKKLIGMINNMLSNSNLKVNWDNYIKQAKEMGIIVDDPYRNRDINDPEG